MKQLPLRGALRREVRSVRDQLAAYADEADLWRTPLGVSNSAGTLALHLAGNLRHFIGFQLGGIAYERNRDAEFTRRDVPRADILADLEAAEDAVDATLAKLTASQLDAPYPLRLAGVELTTASFLIHLHAHLSYHLGQIDYHRRLVTGDPGEVDMLAIPALLQPAETTED